MIERSRHEARDLEGISFTIDHLTRLRALSLPDVGIEIDTRGSDVEELVVFRLISQPGIIAATLRQSVDGSFKILGYDLSSSSNSPQIEASFPGFELAVYALTALFSEEHV